MKPYIKKLTCKKGYDYRLFFIDKYGNLYGGIRSFKTWRDALKFALTYKDEL